MRSGVRVFARSAAVLVRRNHHMSLNKNLNKGPEPSKTWTGHLLSRIGSDIHRVEHRVEN